MEINMAKREILEPENISALVRELLASGLTQRKLAAITGVSQPTLVRILHGASNCTLENFIRLRDAGRMLLTFEEED